MSSILTMIYQLLNLLTKMQDQLYNLSKKYTALHIFERSKFFHIVRKLKTVKDKWHKTYVMMLCKHWTSMISASLFWNVCVKKKLKYYFFSFLKLMNTYVWIPPNLNYKKIRQSLRFGEYFPFWKGFWLVVKLVADKAIRQKSFLYTILFLR